MKVLFLDMDGVVNSAEYFTRVDTKKGLPPKPTRVDRYTKKIDPELVQRLNEIIGSTGAKVVISSSWRVLLKGDEIAECLERNGFIGEVIDVTLRLHWDDRGTEIQTWLDNTQEDVDSFVILDDDSDMGPVMDKLVQTTWAQGLQPEHVERAVEALNNKIL